ncbi:hypothetical protein BSKO_05183 [Bryopsis sp. KO-2023]|nr:hypothetical protein BSKO_05183 [Bryopsis sp. KO-2023]
MAGDGTTIEMEETGGGKIGVESLNDFLLIENMLEVENRWLESSGYGWRWDDDWDGGNGWRQELSGEPFGKKGRNWGQRTMHTLLKEGVSSKGWGEKDPDEMKEHPSMKFGV